MADNNHYCSMVYRGMQIWADGSLKPCCMYKNQYDEKQYSLHEYDEWWSSGMSEIRENYKNNIPSKGCSACFDPKYRYNKTIKDSSTESCDNDGIPRYEVSKYPEFIDITFGNICNLKCVMCNSTSSSKIDTEYKKYKDEFNSIGFFQPLVKPFDYWWKNKDTLNKVKEMVSQATYINFSGGEPLVNDEIVDILLALPENGLTVTINTNLTKITEDQFNALLRLANAGSFINIDISLDGIGNHHEYIRDGALWKTIEQNYKYIENNRPAPQHEPKRGIHMSFSFLLQHTSLFTFPDLYDYFKDTEYEKTLRLGTLQSPELAAIHSASPQDIEKFSQWFENNKTCYDDLIKFWLSTYNFDQKLHEKFKSYISLLDSIRGKDFRSTFNPSW